jgi:hypothetical protein
VVFPIVLSLPNGGQRKTSIPQPERVLFVFFEKQMALDQAFNYRALPSRKPHQTTPFALNQAVARFQPSSAACLR